MKDKRVMVNLNERQFAALQKACDVTGMTFSGYIRTCLNVLANRFESEDVSRETFEKGVVGDANVKDTFMY